MNCRGNVKRIGVLRLRAARSAQDDGIELCALVDGVVGLVAPGGVEGWVERGGGGGAEFEVVLEGVGGVGVGGGDGCGVQVTAT